MSERAILDNCPFPHDEIALGVLTGLIADFERCVDLNRFTSGEDFYQGCLDAAVDARDLCLRAWGEAAKANPGWVAIDGDAIVDGYLEKLEGSG